MIIKNSLFVSIFVMFFLIGCGNKSYQYIRDIKKENNSIIICHKNFNPSKKVFKKLSNDLSDDFIYIFSWVNHLPLAGTNHFRGLIYDRKSNKTFYISNTLEDTKSINITDNTIDFNEQKFILNYYLENNIDTLITLSPAFGSSEVGSQYYLFDSASKEAFIIKNLVLNDDGEIFK